MGIGVKTTATVTPEPDEDRSVIGLSRSRIKTLRKNFSIRREKTFSEAFVINFSENLRAYLFEAGGYALTASLLSLVCVVLSFESGKTMTSRFYGSSATGECVRKGACTGGTAMSTYFVLSNLAHRCRFLVAAVPPIINNHTVVPYAPWLRDRYFCEPMGSPPTHYVALLPVNFWVCVWGVHLLRSLVMFKTTNTGKVLASLLAIVTAIALALVHLREVHYRAEHGDVSRPYNPSAIIFPTVNALVAPILFTTAYAWSKHRIEQKKKGRGSWELVKTYCVFFGFLCLETIFGLIFLLFIFPTFWREGTSLALRFFYRLSVPVITLYVAVEAR